MGTRVSTRGYENNTCASVSEKKWLEWSTSCVGRQHVDQTKAWKWAHVKSDEWAAFGRGCGCGAGTGNKLHEESREGDGIANQQYVEDALEVAQSQDDLCPNLQHIHTTH